MNLYQLSAEYQTALIKLNDSDLPEDVISDTLEGLAGAIEVKGSNVAAFALNLEAEAAAIKQVEERLSERRKKIEARAQKLKCYLKTNMERCGITEIKALDNSFVIALKNNPPSVIINAESQIPDDFMRVIPEKREPDKIAIKKAINDGLIIPGVHLEQSLRLEIK